MDCKHEQFQTYSRIGRLTDSENPELVTGFNVDIIISCTQCGMKFEWIGVPGGYSPIQPMVNFDATELRAPIRPSTDPAEQVRVMVQERTLEPVNNDRERLIHIKNGLTEAAAIGDLSQIILMRNELDKWLMDTATAHSHERKYHSYGYLCKGDDELVFVIADNIAGAMDTLGERYKNYSVEQASSIPIYEKLEP